jgi:hypothetical protein
MHDGRFVCLPAAGYRISTTSGDSNHQTGEKSAKTVPSADGLLVVDYAKDGKPIGVEITAPTAVPLDRLNRLLANLGETPLNEHDYLPVRAA